MSRRSPAPAPPQPAAAPPAPREPLTRRLRDLADELVFVFVIVMFVKLFLVELYKIPTGSMTPTLLGGHIAHVDLNEDGRRDIIYFDQDQSYALAFVWNGERYVARPDLNPDGPFLDRLIRAGRTGKQFDRILVNKLAYWFRGPRRGEIVIFKVPRSIYRREAPIYIKRLVGEPNDLLTFDPAGRLIVNGRLQEEPDFFKTQRYNPVIRVTTNHFERIPDIHYLPEDRHSVRLESIAIPEGHYYVFGDNTAGSLDSRYWGGVEQDHFKGRAFLRVWPLTQFNYLK
ncbi:MAG TPA: signal peptidase I [Candidatus Sumerlaeota bacterium]|nr:signal peptidase I [Candidatus Sumerlaeota bacterium]